MSFFAGQDDSKDEYQTLRQTIIEIGKQGYVQSEINKYMVGNPYLTTDIIKLVKVEIMKRVIEMEM